jgi:xylulokinase
MAEKFTIAIDIGTSGTKTLLYSREGKVISEALCEYPMYQPKNGWAEQDPLDWKNAAISTLAEVISKSGVNNEDIAGVGLSGQMHGLVMMDKNDNILRRSIIWCDQRTGKEAAELTDTIGREKLIEITANPALTGFTASKILWVKNNEPEIFKKCVKIMLPKDYVRYILTGEFATEVSDASGMQLLDVPKRAWSPYILDKLGIDIAKLGKMYESCEVTGKISKETAALTGLREGTPVAGGAGDQAASAVGSGIVREGVASVTIGTSGVVFVHTDKFTTDPLGRAHTLCHAVPGAWHVMGVTQSAGLSFKWIRDNLFGEVITTANETGVSANYLIDKISALVPAGANGLIFLPYLMGERTPILDPNARGVFFGLSAMHTKSDMLRAVMEGVIYSLYDCLRVIESMGASMGNIYASGGGAVSGLWRQMMADVFQRPILVNSESTQSSALGAAILAGVAGGIYGSVREACDLMSVNAKITATEPNQQNYDVYSRYYTTYVDLYNATKQLFAQL